jgi:hypothetical protein
MESLYILSSALRAFLILTSPVVFIVGLYLLYDFNTYLKIEKMLSKSYFQVKITWLEKLEKNRFWLHEFLIKRRRLLGAICLVDAVIIVLANFRSFKYF